MRQLKIGNKDVFTIGVKDNDGVLITDLNTAVEIYYMIKTNSEDANEDALVSKTKTGGGIIIDTPSTGYVQITIAASDIEDVVPGKKYHALQIDYPSDNIQEIWLKTDQGHDEDRIELVQDVIR